MANFELTSYLLANAVVSSPNVRELIKCHIPDYICKCLKIVEMSGLVTSVVFQTLLFAVANMRSVNLIEDSYMAEMNLLITLGLSKQDNVNLLRESMSLLKELVDDASD